MSHPLRWLTEKKMENKCWQGYGEIGTLSVLVNGIAAVENCMADPHDLAMSLLGIYTKELKAEVQIDTCTPVFIAALFTIAKRGK